MGDRGGGGGGHRRSFNTSSCKSLLNAIQILSTVDFPAAVCFPILIYVSLFRYRFSRINMLISTTILDRVGLCCLTVTRMLQTLLNM